jgi:hypothetical protein
MRFRKLTSVKGLHVLLIKSEKDVAGLTEFFRGPQFANAWYRRSFNRNVGIAH